MALQITANLDGGAQVANAYARIVRLVIEPDSPFVTAYMQVLMDKAARDGVKANLALAASKQAAKAAAQAQVDAGQGSADAQKSLQAQVIQLGQDALAALGAAQAVTGIMPVTPVHIPVSALAADWYAVTATMVYDWLATNQYPGAVAAQ